MSQIVGEKTNEEQLNKKVISVVIPVFNEEANVSRVYMAVKTVLLIIIVLIRLIKNYKKLQRMIRVFELFGLSGILVLINHC